MARNEFFRDVRLAMSLIIPRVETDTPFTDARYLEQMLQRSDLWLAQGVVAAFRPEDFTDLDEETRKDLNHAVNEFLAVARAVPAQEPATTEQRNEALKPFMRIVKVVQRYLCDDWLKASNQLLAEAEGWAKETGWPGKRYTKNVTEDFIGTYSLERLVFSAEGAQLALIPVGRFAPGTDGLFDLAVMPAYDSVMVVRQGNRWFIHPLPGEDGRQDWSRDAFVATSLQLARLP